MPTCDDHWKLIIPEATTNLVLNPSAEIANNFAARAGTTVTRPSTYQKYGLYAYRVQTNAADEGINLTTATLANAVHYVTLRVTGTLPAAWRFLVGGVYFTPRELEKLDASWTVYGAQLSADACNGQTAVSVVQSGAGTGDFYLDGIQVEQKTYPTTYCDGDQGGCNWNGVAHASTATRSAQSRAGGRVRDFWDDYHFLVEQFSGTGMPPQSMSVDEYAILPGGRLNAAKTGVRSFSLIGAFLGENEQALYQYRQDLLDALNTDRYPYHQPVRLRFNGATVHKEIAAHFEAGLSTQLNAYAGPFRRDLMSDEVELTYQFRERVALRFLADDPFWYEIGESATILDTNDSATLRYVAARLRSSGQWDPLGPPNAAGTYTAVYAIAEDDVYVYVGGDFTNFDNIANADYVARWHKQDEAWSALGTGTDDVVRALAIGPGGTLYAGGDFANAGGGAAAAVASWDGTNWSAMGAGVDDVVRAMVVGADGLLYVGGDFHNAGGAAAAHIAKWSGAAWSAVGTGLDDVVRALTVGIDGKLYIGGDFTDIDGGGGGIYNYIAYWDVAVYGILSTGMDAAVKALAVTPDGTLYAGGDFNTAGAASADYIASWNGLAWSEVGGGMNNAVGVLAAGADGTVYSGGDFTTNTADYFLLWNGSTWYHSDLNLPANAFVAAILASRHADPVIYSYDIFLGLRNTGTGYFSGAATVTNAGTQPASPAIVLTRSGGTTATLLSIRNETTSRELLFDYDLQDGETLTIDLSPAGKTIYSSFYGLRLDAILPNSDFGTFTLQPGANTITCFVDVTGGPTITGWMEWRDSYKSQD